MSVVWEDFFLDGSWGSGGAALTKSLSDTATLTDAAAKTATRRPSDTSTLTDTAVKAVTLSRTDATTTVDQAAKTVSAAKADSLVAVDSEQSTGDLAEVVGAVKSEVIVIADSSRMSYTLRPEDFAASDDAINVGIVQDLTLDSADTLSIVDAFVVSLAIPLALSDAVATSDNFLQPAFREPTLGLLPEPVGSLTFTPIS